MKIATAARAIHIAPSAKLSTRAILLDVVVDHMPPYTSAKVLPSGRADRDSSTDTRGKKRKRAHYAGPNAEKFHPRTFTLVGSHRTRSFRLHWPRYVYLCGCCRNKPLLQQRIWTHGPGRSHQKGIVLERLHQVHLRRPPRCSVTTNLKTPVARLDTFLGDRPGPKFPPQLLDRFGNCSLHRPVAACARVRV